MSEKRCGRLDRYNAARQILEEYAEGIWLVSKKKNIYQYTFLKDYEEKKFVYGGELTLSTQKTTFERGELLLKLVSLNMDAIKPIVTYLSTEIRQHQKALPDINAEWKIPETVKELIKELLPRHKKERNKNTQRIDKETDDYVRREEDKIFYTLDRMQELHYQAFHRLIQEMPFEISESFSINEVDLIVDLLMSECIHIYKDDYFRLSDKDSYIPQIFWDDELKERIKDFLCNPKDCSTEEINLMLAEGAKKSSIIVNGEIFHLINIKSFNELIAFEVENIVARPSDFRKCVRCEVCGKLFYKKSGKGKNVCDYRFKGRILCANVMNDEFDKCWRNTYNNLKSYLGYYGIPTEEIYKEFYKKVNELLEKYRGKNGFETFKAELDTYYDALQKKTEGYHQYS